MMAKQGMATFLVALMMTNLLSAEVIRIKRDKGLQPGYAPIVAPQPYQPAALPVPAPAPQAAPAGYAAQSLPQYPPLPPPPAPAPAQYQVAPAPAPYSPPPPPPPPAPVQYQPLPPPPAPYVPPAAPVVAPPPPPPAPVQYQVQPLPPPPPPAQPQYQVQPLPPSPPPAQPQYQVQPLPPPPPPAPAAEPQYQVLQVPPLPPPPAPLPISVPAPAQYEVAPISEVPQQLDVIPTTAAPIATTISQYIATDAAVVATPESSGVTYAPSLPITVPPVAEDNNIISGTDVPATTAVSAPISSGPREEKKEESQWTKGSIPYVLEQMGFNSLNDLLILASLDNTLDKEGPFTVFVPVDQAFEALTERFGGQEAALERFNQNPDGLTSLLKHHVIPGVVPSAALQNNLVMRSAIGTPLRIRYYESEDREWRPLKVVTINGARIIRPDIQATNGVIHIIDRVLFPIPQADIYNTLRSDPEQRFTTLVAAIDRAGLTQVLAHPLGGPFTVFAPTNKAFSLISRADLNAILNDPVRLTKLLQRHVVQDLIYTAGLQGFQKAYALDYELLYIFHGKGMTKVNGANVVDQDITALNGVIHTIDSVLGV